MDLSVLSFEGLRRTQNLHPLFVHFPLALLPTSFCFFAIGAVFRRQDFQFAGRAVLLLATISMILAWFTGFRAEAALGVVEPRSAVLRSHLTIGTILTGMTVFLFAWSRAYAADEPRPRWLFLALFGIAVMGSLVTGDLGAQLVYVKGASVQSQGAQNPKKF